MATFLNYDKPLLCAMIMCDTPDECIAKIKRSLSEGAEAIGIHLCRINREYRTKEHLKRIFDSCEGKPIYVTSYRVGKSEGYTDDECVELLLLALDAGATLLDVMGDLYDTPVKPKYELSLNPVAIEKQKSLIEEIHRRGGEVIMSCHTEQSTTMEENLMIAHAQVERGADVLKIVSKAERSEEIPEYIESIQKIVSESEKKLLLLVSGEGKIMRYIGPCFGVCMYLCVVDYGPYDNKSQPTLNDLVNIRERIPCQR